MSDAKHTAGPWFVSDTLAIGPTGQIVACVRADHPQAKANASLIAAAPDLLEVAKTALRILEKEFPNGAAVIDLRAALSKAE